MSVEINLERVSRKLGVVVCGLNLSTFKVEVKGQGFKVMFNYLNSRDPAFFLKKKRCRNLEFTPPKTQPLEAEAGRWRV